VAEPAFKAVVLDLFDTLVKWEPDRLPLMELNGRQMRSTMPWVFPKIIELFGQAFTPDRFIEVYSAVNEEIMFEREREGIEITCHERFLRTLQRLFQLKCPLIVLTWLYGEGSRLARSDRREPTCGQGSWAGVTLGDQF